MSNELSVSATTRIGWGSVAILFYDQSLVGARLVEEQAAR